MNWEIQRKMGRYTMMPCHPTKQMEHKPRFLLFCVSHIMLPHAFHLLQDLQNCWAMYGKVMVHNIQQVSRFERTNIKTRSIMQANTINLRIQVHASLEH